jgi:hypothetical protein
MSALRSVSRSVFLLTYNLGLGAYMRQARGRSLFVNATAG